MTKTICIFSDGTGQAGGDNPIHWTSVYRLYKFTRDISPRQTAFYDPGLGSDPDLGEENAGLFAGFTKWISQATGLGITRNIVDCYCALLLAYEPGDRIFLFGFSRGAYTVRSLGGVLSLCGLPVGARGGALPVTRWDQFRRGFDRVRPLAETAVKNVYQIRDDAARQAAAAAFRRDHQSHAALPYFIGVWDTVRALGIKGLSDLIGLRHAFHNAELNPAVPYGRHALAIDEDREVFKPELWDERPAPATQSIKQVWFAGVHADIGGGYADSRGLSDIALGWMIDEAAAVPHPLIIDPALDPPLAPDPQALQHDERQTSFVPWFAKDRRGFVASPLQVPPAQFHPSVPARFAAAGVPHLNGTRPYRPDALRGHPDFASFYPA
ncbi:MAG: DUF2235 domain-containing protein [Beijerinckiaceae bacterium]